MRSRPASQLAVHLGVAVALAAATLTGIGVAAGVGAAGAASSFVPITPCRLMDTRPAPDNIGARTTPIGPDGTYDALVWGTNGNCTIPTTATAVSLNVTAIGPTANSFLTVYPSDATRPLAASLNWITNQPPTPNAVTTTLSTNGRVSFYNLAGNVDLTADIVGYYQPADLPVPGPQGATGATGPTGATGATGPVGGANRLTPAQIAMRRWDLDPGRRATVDLGRTSNAVAFDGTSIWVTSFPADTVQRVDPATNTVTATIAVGDGPIALAWAAGSIWVANANAGTVSRVDPATSSVTATISLGVSPRGLAYDGIRLLAANSNGTVTRIDPATNATAGAFTVAFGASLSSIVFDGTDAWVSDIIGDTVRRVDPGIGAVEGPIAVGADPLGLAFDGTYLWVANSDDNSVSKIDPATYAVVATISPIAGGALPQDLAYDGTSMWVTTVGNAIVRINPASNTVTSVPVGSSTIGIAYDGTNLWVSGVGSTLLWKALPS